MRRTQGCSTKNPRHWPSTATKSRWGSSERLSSSGNRTYAIYFSSGARDTLIQGCTIRGSINLQPSNLGGHRILGNYFGTGSYLFAVYGNSTDAPSALVGNTFENTPAVTFRTSGDYPNGWTIARNVFLGSTVTSVGLLSGEGHIVRDNTFVDAKTDGP